MRIVCQKCAAAYAIDDRLITAKGVRAQCPRCRHLQLVRRDPSAAPSAGAPAPAPQPAAPATPQPAPAASAPDDLFGDFGSPAPAAPPPGPSAGVPAPSARPAQAAPTAASNPDLFADFGSMPSLGPTPVPPIPDPFPDLGGPARAAPGTGPAPGEDPLLDFLGPAPVAPPAPVARITGPAGSAPIPVAPPQAAAPTPRAAAPAPAPAAPKEATSGCRSCGKPLTDAFDQALGMCDDCRQRGQAPAKGAPAAAPATPAAGSLDFLPPMTTLDGPSSPPVEPAPPVGSRGAAAPALGAEPRSSPRAPSAEARIPISTDIIPDLGPEPRSGQRSAAPGLGPEPRSASRMAPVRTASVERPSRGRGVLVGALALLLLGGGGAAGFFFYQRHQEEARRRAVPPPPPPVPAAVQAVLPRWKLKYLELSGTSAERLAEGQQLLAREERFAYAEAEESFQQALLLDPNNDAAIAGYVQALALGRGAGMDDATFQEARSLVEAAESRAGRTPPLLLAHANLLLSRARQPELLDPARTRAEEVLGLAEATAAQKAEAHLVLGRAYLATSGQLARSHFESAQKLAPDLKRVAYYNALAYESAGDYKSALDTLRTRLKANPQDWDSLAVTSRIYQEVGEADEARQLYEARVRASPGELRALLPLAVLRYQSEDKAAQAVRELRALLKNRSRYEDRDLAEVLVHLAAAERAAGNAELGAKAAAEALEQVEDLPEAHLQLFLVALGRSDAAAARTHLAGLQGWLGDPALEKVLEGRLLLLEKKPVEALERFQEAVRLDDRRLDAQLLVGVAAAAAKRRDDAFRALNHALTSDPLRLEPRPVATRFWLRQGETVQGVENVILGLATGSEDASAQLYEGLLRFHQGELDAADRHFRNVLEVDDANAGALAYRALIALRRGNEKEAGAVAARAVYAGRQMSIAYLAQGLALAEARQVEPARRALREARKLSPGLLSAQAKLAELERPDVARDLLMKVVGLDPAYLPAKKTLYRLNR